MPTRMSGEQMRQRADRISAFAGMDVAEATQAAIRDVLLLWSLLADLADRLTALEATYQAHTHGGPRAGP